MEGARRRTSLVASRHAIPRRKPHDVASVVFDACLVGDEGEVSYASTTHISSPGTRRDASGVVGGEEVV